MKSLRLPALLLLLAIAPRLQPDAASAPPQAAIDRHALVTRHNPVIRSVDVDAPLTVGNGGFAFGCDITGLQTLAGHYQRWGIPVETQSRWCWVSDPNPKNFTLADASRDYTLPGGGTLPFPTRASTPAGDWLRKNPRAHPLAQLALDYTRPDGARATLSPADIQEPFQTLDLWRGIVTSRFKLDGVPVQVETACAPGGDTIAVRITSPLVSPRAPGGEIGKLRVRLAFPRGHNMRVKNTPDLDWSAPETHESKLIDRGHIERRVGGTAYYVRSDHALKPDTGAPHTFFIANEAAPGPGGDDPAELAFVLDFSPRRADAPPPAPARVFHDSAAHWETFWNDSAAVDFTGSTHPLAPRIEERIILSRYLMAAQMAGDTPPQESGLTCNTWYGKHHTEMIWWHTAHFPLWGNGELLAKNLAWYQSQLPAARALAAERGLKGARWAKMTGPEMRESPGGNPLIVWNQPHTIYLCELLWRNAAATTPAAAAAVLQRHRALVLETADCMASMLHFDKARDRYVLGPPLWIVQEIHDQATSQNPSFELAYWRWALATAQHWRERLGLPRDEHHDHILAHLSPLPQKDGKYVALESHPDTWDNIKSRHDHPEMLMPLGFLPGGPGVDRDTMNRTLDAVLAHWDWETKIWGWDYPMIAMTAARLGRPRDALDILMRDGPNNRYLPTGHCPQRSDEAMPANPPPGARKREIAVYLPANGAFLSAVALMVGGWDGAEEAFPGFPKDGTWSIRAEGLRPLP
ncbi:MAG: hypothetical protein LBI02_03640 [Opitutaceae bacterium]|nr:hypothetical protein [Opitutaceae bacterium]